MMECFEIYWDGEMDVAELQENLREYAGYVPPIEKYELYTFLLDKEFH